MPQTTHIALLRGVNVGGKNLLRMSELRAIFAAAGCENVRTYIQSGNVVFEAVPDIVAALPRLITAQITAQYGYAVPVVVRTAGQMAAVVRNNPFIQEGKAEQTLHVLFLAETADAERVRTLDPERSPPDTFIVREQEVYLHLPNGAARTRLTNSYFDTKLATVSTGRNWQTVTKLFALMAR